MRLFGTSPEALAQARAHIEFLQRQLAAADARYDRLLAQFTRLRVTNLATIEPEPESEPEPEPAVAEMAVDELQSLVFQVAGPNYAKRGMMLRALARDRADGRDEDAIRRDIEHGIQPEGVPA